MSTVETVRAACENNELISVTDLAKRAEVTKSRVYSILKKENLTLNKPDHPNSPHGKRGNSDGMAVPRVVTGGTAVKRLSSAAGGSVSEFLATADLIARGHSVYRPSVGKGEPFDLIVLFRNGEDRCIGPYTFEVRSAYRNRYGKIVYNKNRAKRRPEPDYYALVVTGEPVIFEPELHDDC